MDAAVELGRNPVSKHQIQPECGDEQADAGRDCRTRLARPNFRRERGQGNIHFPCLADREQDWQRYPVDILIVLYILSAVNADGVWRVKVNIWTPPWNSGGIP